MWKKFLKYFLMVVTKHYRSVKSKWHWMVFGNDSFFMRLKNKQCIKSSYFLLKLSRFCKHDEGAVVEIRDFVDIGENRASEAIERKSRWTWEDAVSPPNVVRGKSLKMFWFNTYQVQAGVISYYALRFRKMQINIVKFSQKIYM